MAKHSRRRRRRPPQDIPCLLGWVALAALCDGSKAEKTIPKDESSSALKKDEAGHGNRRKWFDFRWFLTARNDDCHKFRPLSWAFCGSHSWVKAPMAFPGKRKVTNWGTLNGLWIIGRWLGNPIEPNCQNGPTLVLIKSYHWITKQPGKLLQPQQKLDTFLTAKFHPLQKIYKKIQSRKPTFHDTAVLPSSEEMKCMLHEKKARIAVVRLKFEVAEVRIKSQRDDFSGLFPDFLLLFHLAASFLMQIFSFRYFSSVLLLSWLGCRENLLRPQAPTIRSCSGFGVVRSVWKRPEN